jgi:hypothetical protein
MVTGLVTCRAVWSAIVSGGERGRVFGELSRVAWRGRKQGALHGLRLAPHDSRCCRAKVLLLARFPQKFIEHHRRLPGRDSSTNNPRHVGSAHSLIELGSVFVNRSIASLAIVASTGDSVCSVFQSVDRPSKASWGTRVVRAAHPLIVAISSGDGFRDWRTAQPAR